VKIEFLTSLIYICVCVCERERERESERERERDKYLLQYVSYVIKINCFQVYHRLRQNNRFYIAFLLFRW